MTTTTQPSRLIAIAAIAAIAGATMLGGCADMSGTQRGTATGAGIGAGLGAILGASTGGGGGGRTAGGAVLGAAAGAAIGNVWSTRMENQKRTMEQATQGTGVQVTQTADNRLKLAIPSDISFDTNRSDIKPDFRPVLDRFGNSLNDNPSTVVTIVGHTDNTGSPAVNNPLSVDRASKTRDYLISRGIAPGRFTIEGRGANDPIASNNDSNGRARNRRVEIFVAERQQ
ncbi:OmpA family protein [Actimicrobium sp. CCI2.3]|uniref:OmpA family protein n=1 Tax=Actimicrobium sp. CCI2.3 TaxID=3048616 RepID=UPI002AB3E4CE|nr:OmpA family protein [Actimicrobium sp. CCI2.3]MDY7574943.1 OmpA family protein [Actimicrobium sp. CCI2.3]MEB0021486.1 OmpA family protein [Actimicrobium sp. CCI2.3]